MFLQPQLNLHQPHLTIISLTSKIATRPLFKTLDFNQHENPKHFGDYYLKPLLVFLKSLFSSSFVLVTGSGTTLCHLLTHNDSTQQEKINFSFFWQKKRNYLQKCQKPTCYFSIKIQKVTIFMIAESLKTKNEIFKLFHFLS